MADAVVEISNLVEKQMHNIEITARQSQEVAAIAQQTSASAQEVAQQQKNKPMRLSK